jgi:chorismate mutase
MNEQLCGWGVLDDIRKRIDSVDDDIVRLLAIRCALVREVGVVKRELGHGPADPHRELDIMARLGVARAQEGLDPDFLFDIYRMVFRESKRIQKDER